MCSALHHTQVEYGKFGRFAPGYVEGGPDGPRDSAFCAPFWPNMPQPSRPGRSVTPGLVPKGSAPGKRIGIGCVTKSNTIVSPERNCGQNSTRAPGHRLRSATALLGVHESSLPRPPQPLRLNLRRRGKMRDAPPTRTVKSQTRAAVPARRHSLREFWVQSVVFVWRSVIWLMACAMRKV